MGPLVFLALMACASSELDDTGDLADDTAKAATGDGSLMLSFKLLEDLIPSMSEAPVGTFRGSIFAEEDASSIGPVDGAVALESLEVGLDLSGGTQADALASGPLAPGIYWVLGCLDTDDNDCDKSDPITVPNENKVQVLPGDEAAFEVYFGMLNPS